MCVSGLPAALHTTKGRAVGLPQSHALVSQSAVAGPLCVGQFEGTWQLAAPGGHARTSAADDAPAWRVVLEGVPPEPELADRDLVMEPLGGGGGGAAVGRVGGAVGGAGRGLVMEPLGGGWGVGGAAVSGAGGAQRTQRA